MKNYFKKNMAEAFSLTETIIMLTILAIAVASMTPMVTRKIVNNTEAGTTINGVAHGRYEIYSKEIVTYGSDSYEKTTKPTGGGVSFFGGDETTILVFERLDDRVYAQYMNESPTMNNKGQKSTLYEQFNDTKPHRTPNGDIDYVEIKKGGSYKKYPVGGNIIVESSDIIYKKGNITPGNPPTFTESKGASSVTLPNDINRIIEGVLTTKIAKKSNDGNNLWHIKAENSTESKDKFEGTVAVIPWEKVISGNNTIIDKPIPKDPATGEYVGKFDPGVGTKSLVIHAVGGGGAGGGLKDVGKAVSPKTATTEELNYMKQTLAKRFKEVAAAKGLSQANIPIATLIKEVSNSSIHDANYETQFPNNDTYILLNKSNGSITVKFDTRTGLIFPHELLDYTNILGSQTQESDMYNMPVWGNYNTIATGGERGKPFYAGGVACGGPGGAGASYFINSSSVNIGCKRDFYCKLKTDQPYDGTCCESCCGSSAAKIDYNKLEKDFGITGFASAAKIKENTSLIAIGAGGVTPHEQAQDGVGSVDSCTPKTKPVTNQTRYCFWDCDGTFYGGDDKWLGNGDSCESTDKCPNNCADCSPTSAQCHHKMEGGFGGSSPGCVVACTKANQPLGEIMISCAGGGASGVANPSIVNVNGGGVSLTSGQKGRSCHVFAGRASASAIGGGGGTPCPKTSITLELDFSETEWADEWEKIPKDWTPEQKWSHMAGIIRESTYKKQIDKMDTSAISDTDKDLIARSYAQSAVWDYDDTITRHESGIMSLIVATVKDVYTELSAGDEWVISTPNLQEVQKIIDAGLLHQGALTQAKSGYKVDPSMPCKKAPSCGGVDHCGTDGSPGQASSDCPDTTGIDVSSNGNEKRFNHIYSWTMPYAMNRLVYGEAGEAGEYKTTKIAKTTGELEIHLGVGGVWTDHKDPVNGNWVKGKKGVDGTDTIVKMGGRNVLTAKGGKGGAQSLSTHRYDLCYAKEGTCSRDSGDITCCKNEIGKRSTKEILTTASKMSAFENIKALTGNSLIIGIGLGRGGEGAGSRAQVEELKGLRVFRNSSGYGLNGADKILGPEGSNALDVAEKFKNYALAPSALNFKGGDGAVIITW